MDKRTILEQVASGSLSPEEAAERLGETDAPAPIEQPSGPVGKVRVVGAFRTAKIVGDPTVKTATVDGEHVAEHRDGTLVVTAEAYHPGEVDKTQFRFTSASRPRVVLGLGSKPFPLTIRMNPNLPLEVEMAAGTLSIYGVRSEISAEVSAGSIRIAGFAAPLNVSVAGGSVTAEGVLDRGESKIRCEAGAVKVRLSQGSSVRVRGRAGLGRIELPGTNAGFIVGSGTRESVIGEGAGSLDIDVSMGVVSVMPA